MKNNVVDKVTVPNWMSNLISDELSSTPRKRSSSFDTPTKSPFQTLDLPAMLRDLKQTEVSDSSFEQ
jgi:hypothetical protein